MISDDLWTVMIYGKENIGSHDLWSVMIFGEEDIGSNGSLLLTL